MAYTGEDSFLSLSKKSRWSGQVLYDSSQCEELGFPPSCCSATQGTANPRSLHVSKWLLSPNFYQQEGRTQGRGLSFRFKDASWKLQSVFLRKFQWAKPSQKRAEKCSPFSQGVMRQLKSRASITDFCCLCRPPLPWAQRSLPQLELCRMFLRPVPRTHQLLLTESLHVLFFSRSLSPSPTARPPYLFNSCLSSRTQSTLPAPNRVKGAAT